MGQKVHPLGLRLGISQPHRTVWCTSPKNYGRFILEDRQLRQAVLEIAELRQIVSTPRNRSDRTGSARVSERTPNGTQGVDLASAGRDSTAPNPGGSRAKARLRRSSTASTARGTARSTAGDKRGASTQDSGPAKTRGLQSLQRRQAERLKPKAVVSTMFHTSRWRYHIREEDPVEISDIVIHRRRLHHGQDPSAPALDIIELYVHTTRPVQLIHGTNKAEFVQSVIDYQQRLERVVRALRPSDGPRVRVLLNVFQVAEPEKSAQILAQRLVARLEKREKFRPALKRVLREAQDASIDGVKIQIAGRLNGAEIARTEWVRRGSVPLQTLRAGLDYASLSAKTTYGLLGIKVWTFRRAVVNLT